MLGGSLHLTPLDKLETSADQLAIAQLAVLTPALPSKDYRKQDLVLQFVTLISFCRCLAVHDTVRHTVYKKYIVIVIT